MKSPTFSQNIKPGLECGKDGLPLLRSYQPPRVSLSLEQHVAIDQDSTTSPLAPNNLPLAPH